MKIINLFLSLFAFSLVVAQDQPMPAGSNSDLVINSACGESYIDRSRKLSLSFFIIKNSTYVGSNLQKEMHLRKVESSSEKLSQLYTECKILEEDFAKESLLNESDSLQSDEKIKKAKVDELISQMSIINLPSFREFRQSTEAQKLALSLFKMKLSEEESLSQTYSKVKNLERVQTLLKQARMDYFDQLSICLKQDVTTKQLDCLKKVEEINFASTVPSLEKKFKNIQAVLENSIFESKLSQTNGATRNLLENLHYGFSLSNSTEDLISLAVSFNSQARGHGENAKIYGEAARYYMGVTDYYSKISQYYGNVATGNNNYADYLYRVSQYYFYYGYNNWGYYYYGQYRYYQFWAAYHQYYSNLYKASSEQFNATANAYTSYANTHTYYFSLYMGLMSSQNYVMTKAFDILELKKSIVSVREIDRNQDEDQELARQQTIDKVLELEEQMVTSTK